MRVILDIDDNNGVDIVTDGMSLDDLIDLFDNLLTELCERRAELTLLATFNAAEDAE